MATTALRTVLVDSDADARTATRRLLMEVPTVTLVGEYSDLQEALLYAPATRADLLVVEVDADESQATPPAVTAIEQLAGKLPETAILATGRGISAELVIRVLRAGALEFLRRPVERADLVAALEKLARFRGAAPQRHPGRITSIFAPKGGLGATTLATNLAVSMAELAKDQTLLVEVDTRQSDIVTFLDLRPRYSILDVVENVGRMDESLLRGLLTRHTSGLWVAPGPTRVERGQFSAEHISGAIEVLRTHFDHVVMDLRHDFDPGTIAALEASDVILFVTSLDVAALRSGAAALGAFRHLGLDSKKVKVVVMRDGTADDVTLRHARDTLGLPVYWRTPSDYPTVVASINAGQPVVSTSPRARIAKNLRELAETLCGEGRPGPGPTRRTASLLSMAWPIKRLSGA
jgi:pilus assembly protein CpaE